MKTTMISMLRHIFFRKSTRKNVSFHKEIMRLNNFDNSISEAERKWSKKWSVFGGKPSPVYYRIFRNFVGDDMNIVPEDVFHFYIEPVICPRQYLGYYSDKNMFDKIFASLNCFPKTIVRQINGVWYDASYSKLQMTETLLVDILGHCITDKLIIKPSTGTCSGVGVSLFIRRNGNWLNEGGKFESLTLDLLNRRYHGNVIVQEAVNQSAYISQFNPTSVNTLRIAIYRSVIDNQPRLVGSIMRIGKSGSFIDNAHAGGGFIAIRHDGTLGKEVLDQYGRRTTTFNGINFANNSYCIPHWKQVKAFACAVADFIYHHRLVALDIVLDSHDAPKLIEINVGSFSTWFFQYTGTTDFGDYTDEIIEYCKKNQVKHQIHI